MITCFYYNPDLNFGVIPACQPETAALETYFNSNHTIK